MDHIPLATSSTFIPLEEFWKSVVIYHDRPNIINRKVAAVSPVLFCKVSINNSDIKCFSDIFTWEALLYEIRKLPDFTKITPQFIRNITETYDKFAAIEETNWDIFHNTFDGHFLSIRILFSRKCNEKCVEIVIFDKDRKTVTFFAVQEQNNQTVAPRFPYHIQLTKTGNLTIILNSFEDADTPSAEWLADKLFPKLIKWAENDINDNSIIKSLNLVSTSHYCTTYSDLKTKYSKDLVEKWPQKANTDPQKYVFEDIAIAAYLICLWGHKNVSFVDCGCGNGLLVYILNREGFKGYGLDIRRRKTWDIYGDDADLRVGVVTPNSIFPEATWLIGNHSDELTPWIPIIAVKSSPKMNYFVLPCCPYDLNGRKYVRKNNALSQYGDYLDYIKKISSICGFTTKVDKLRIPSTKRICLVGTREENRQQIDDIKEVQEFLERNQTVDFTPKESVEKVRNCTRLDSSLKQRIIMLVMDELLKSCNMLKGKFDGTPWNQGGTISLRKLSQKVSADDRKLLKNEFGGLQTLLKNHRYIFEVREGAVSLRAPLSLKESNRYKDKPCWFKQNHPNDCYFSAENCAYKHV